MTIQSTSVQGSSKYKTGKLIKEEINYGFNESASRPVTLFYIFSKLIDRISGTCSPHDLICRTNRHKNRGPVMKFEPIVCLLITFKFCAERTFFHTVTPHHQVSVT